MASRETHVVGRITQLAYVSLPTYIHHQVFCMNIKPVEGGSQIWKFRRLPSAAS